MVKLHTKVLPDPARCREVYCDEIPLVFVARFFMEATKHFIFNKCAQAIFRKLVSVYRLANSCGTNTC